jgi:GTPase SAR1 family protein
MSVQEMTNETTTKESGGLLLDSLEVKNFRAFRHLTIPKLGRVNLITGKNNVGKTTLLEALHLYSSGLSPRVLNEILSRREELDFSGSVFPGVNPHEESVMMTSEDLMFHYASLLSIAESGYKQGIASFGPMGERDIQLSFFKDAERIVFFRNDDVIGQAGLHQIHYEPSSVVVKVDRIPSVLLRSAGFDRKIQAWLFEENSTLVSVRVPDLPFTINGNKNSHTEDYSITDDTVMALLRYLSPQLSHVGIHRSSKTMQYTVEVWLDGFSEPLPLSGLGEGSNRVFGLALAMRKAENGILLIDEIENGLHYSIQEKIWRFVIEASQRLNVQVFATTHSWDCIEAFQKAAAEDDDPSSGVLIRLENKDGDVTSTVFDEESLAYVTYDGIEVR